MHSASYFMQKTVFQGTHKYTVDLGQVNFEKSDNLNPLKEKSNYGVNGKL